MASMIVSWRRLGCACGGQRLGQPPRHHRPGATHTPPGGRQASAAREEQPRPWPTPAKALHLHPAMGHRPAQADTLCSRVRFQPVAAPGAHNVRESGSATAICKTHLHLIRQATDLGLQRNYVPSRLPQQAGTVGLQLRATLQRAATRPHLCCASTFESSSPNATCAVATCRPSARCSRRLVGCRAPGAARRARVRLTTRCPSCA